MLGKARTGKRPAYVASVLAGALVLAGCGGGDKADADRSSSPPAPTGPPVDPKVIASVPLEHKDGPAHVDLLALSRTAENTVTAQFKIVNEGEEPIDLSSSLGEGGHSLDPHQGDVLAASGISLVDARNDKVYFPFRTPEEENKCLCTRLYGNPVKPGKHIDVYATFPAPAVKRVTVQVPLAVPFQDVPIGDDPVKPLKNQVDPTGVKLDEPRVHGLRSFTEGTEKSVNDGPDGRSVLLSTDTLFAVDKADLTPRADRLLRELAEQIDASKDQTVTVDGYADSTGNDAINQPLSERRAKAVADRLKGLITRQGVGFQTAGHGSKDPVASNDTDEGRRKNRRVTVTFSQPSAPPPATGNSSGRSYQRSTSTTLGSGVFQAPEAGGLKVEVNSLHRDASGLVVLVWTLRNTGREKRNFAQQFERRAYLHGSDPRPMRLGTTGGVLLFDSANQVRYNPLSQQNGPCVCSTVGFSGAQENIGAGESVVLWDAYKIPANAANLEMQVPWDRGADAVIKGLDIT